MGWGDACADPEPVPGGRKDAAAQAVPTRMVEDVALVGPANKLCEDITGRWKPTCATTLVLGGWPRPDTRERLIDAIRT